MAQYATYTNGQTALDFKKNGTGLAYYPSGQVAVAVTAPHGGSGRYYNFYLDRTGVLAASFNNEGVGFVSYPSGKPRLNVTKEGGTVSTKTGMLQQEWMWQTNLDRLQLKAPIEFRISNALTVCVRARTDVKVTFQSFTSKVFDCGLPATRGSSGKAELTFFERLEQSSGHGGGADLEKVQDMNWSLPRLSVSGRETEGVLDKDPETLIRGLDVIRDTAVGLKTKLNETDDFNSSITIHKRAAADAVYNSIHKGTVLVKPDFGATYTSEYKQKKRAGDGLVTLKTIQPKELDDFVNGQPGKRLAVVCMTSDKYSESRPAVKMTRWAATEKWKMERAEIEQEERSKRQRNDGVLSSSSTDLGHPVSPGQQKRKQPSRKRLPLDADSVSSNFDFVIVECSKSKLLEKKYNFPAYPMFIFYMGGRVVFAGTRFHRFGEGQEDFYKHLQTMYEEGLLGHVYPEDFQFNSFSAGH